MRAVIQRVTEASVSVDGEVVGAIDGGLLVFLGVGPGDTESSGARLASKISNLRIFDDMNGKMNHSLLDVELSVLVISQFTLYGDCRKGRRPSFVGAAHPDTAKPIYLKFCEQIAGEGVQRVEKGRFGADMKVSLLNDGPVTLIVESP